MQTSENDYNRDSMTNTPPDLIYMLDLLKRENAGLPDEPPTKDAEIDGWATPDRTHRAFDRSAILAKDQELMTDMNVDISHMWTVQETAPTPDRTPNWSWNVKDAGTSFEPYNQTDMDRGMSTFDKGSTPMTKSPYMGQDVWRHSSTNNYNRVSDSL